MDGEYQRFPTRHEDDGSVWSHSDALNLDLWWVDGELRFWDPVGEQWLLSHEEEHDGRLAERGGRLIAEAQMEAERDSRLAETARADAAEARAAELEAELRRMRGE